MPNFDAGNGYMWTTDPGVQLFSSPGQQAANSYYAQVAAGNKNLGFQNDLNGAFQSVLGRNATQSELDFLKPYIDSGNLTVDQAKQYLASTPEALQGRLSVQQGQYQDMLKKNNQAILGQAADAANASFAQNGRQFSTGQGNAVLQAGQQLAAQQAPMIANFYGNNAGYLNDAYMGQGQSALQRAYNLKDSDLAYQRGQDFYTRQQNDFNNYLNGQGTRNMQNALTNAGIGLGQTLVGAGIMKSLF